MIFSIAQKIRYCFKIKYFIIILMILMLYCASIVFDLIALHELIEVRLGSEIVISLLAHTYKKNTVHS